MSKANVDVVRLLEFFNTDRTEIAPWSDVVGIHVERDLGG